MKTRLTLIVLALSALLSAVTGAAGERTLKSLFDIDPLPRRTKLRIGYFTSTIHGLTSYVALENGWFDEANLDVEMTSFVNGPAIMEAKKSWDVTTSGAAGVISGIIGQDVRMIGVGAWDDILNLFVRAEHRIFKSGKGHIAGYPEIWGRPEDWKGTAWLLPAGTAMHYVILTTLGRMGLSSADIAVNNMDVTSAFTAFKADQGDGLGVWNNLGVLGIQSGFKKVSGIRECGSRMATGVIATQEALRDNREAVKKFLEVYLAAAGWMRDNREKTVELYLKTSEEEGINIDREVGDLTLQIITTPPLSEQIAYAEKKTPDPRDPSGRITWMEEIIVEVFDFFASQGRYSEDDRHKILDGHITPSVLLELKDDYVKAGRTIK